MAVREDTSTTELEAAGPATEPREISVSGGGPSSERATRIPLLRLAVAAGFSTVAAAIMVGGVFNGISPRIWATVAGVLGIVVASRVRDVKNPYVMNGLILLSLFAIGIIIAAPGGSFSDVVNLGPFLRDAMTAGNVQRPPIDFTLGWRAILGWLMGGLGFATAWVAIEVRRPALGLMLPLPLVAIAAISVPEDARVATGIGSLVLFAVALGLLSGIDLSDDAEQRSLSFELRRAARALPLLAGLTVALIFLAQANFLFPKPVYDPTQSAQKPKAIPLSKVPDRELFQVSSSVTGPWRMGSLDVYDGKDWRLAPFAENRIKPVPNSGILDTELQPGVKASFKITGLTGAVLPGLPNMVGLIAQGPTLAEDIRSGVIRLASGAIQPGLEYTVTAARIPSVQQLERINQPPPDNIEGIPTKRFLDIPPPPSGVANLIADAPKSSKWAELDFLRNKLLDTVSATGNGTPVSVPPSKVEDMLFGSKQGSPFEIVAGQAMLARWAGIPSRIGYGFDGGDKIAGGFSIRPRNGASFVEVYFTGQKWLPLIGTPHKASSSFNNQQTQTNPTILPSDNFAVQIYVPVEQKATGYFFNQIRAIIDVVLPIVLIVLLLYLLWPAVRKSYVHARRRSIANDLGAPARISLSYAEFRDLATDFGYRHSSDTPLMFLDRVVPDEEHAQLAWLVTRTLWGDLRTDITEDDALAAEELARSLRRRLSQGHTWTLRAIAALSRLSLRYPYAPGLDRSPRAASHAVETREETDAFAGA